MNFFMLGIHRGKTNGSKQRVGKTLNVAYRTAA